jgi:hypothetical protein
MIFIDNKYTRWYYNIINRAKTRSLSDYKEKHHIIPKSMGGDNTKNNLVKLTAREHFVCHMLLVKMTTGKAKRSMAYAAWQMTYIDNRPRYKPSSRMYAILRKQLSESYKGVPKSYIHWLGKNHSEDTKKKQSDAKKGSNNPMFGRTQSAETKRLIGLAHKGKTVKKYQCQCCGKEVAGLGNYNRWHGNKCRINTA